MGKFYIYKKNTLFFFVTVICIFFYLFTIGKLGGFQIFSKLILFIFFGALSWFISWLVWYFFKRNNLKANITFFLSTIIIFLIYLIGLKNNSLKINSKNGKNLKEKSILNDEKDYFKNHKKLLSQNELYKNLANQMSANDRKILLISNQLKYCLDKINFIWQKSFEQFENSNMFDFEAIKLDKKSLTVKKKVIREYLHYTNITKTLMLNRVESFNRKSKRLNVKKTRFVNSFYKSY